MNARSLCLIVPLASLVAMGCSGGGGSHGGGGASVAGSTATSATSATPTTTTSRSQPVSTPPRTRPSAPTTPSTPRTPPVPIVVSGAIPLSYTLVDPQSVPTNVTVSFSLDSGKTWAPATAGPGGDGTKDLKTSPAGVQHTFVWDSLADLGPVLATGVIVEVVPTNKAPILTPSFDVDDRAPAPPSSPPAMPPAPPISTPPAPPSTPPAPPSTPPAPPISTPPSPPAPPPAPPVATPTAPPTGTVKSKEDPLNGLYTVVLDGKPLASDAQIESWFEIGVRLRLQGVVYPLEASGNGLTNPASAPTYSDVLASDLATGTAAVASLNVTYSTTSAGLDVIQGTLGGHTLVLTRDTAPKAPIVLPLPGDRPYRLFQIQQLSAAAQQDRESYTTLDQSKLDAFLQKCVLYQKGYWQYKYMAGKTLADQDASFESMITSVAGLATTPRLLVNEPRFSSGVNAALKSSAKSSAALALTTYSMYFPVGCGRAVRIPIGNDSTIYFVTDRPGRNATIGIVITETGLHAPLAAPFGRQLLDLGAMPATDDSTYGQTLMEMLVKSDSSRASQLSATGRSALTDWYGVMSIEDYRGVAFDDVGLGWGYNMTNAQFFGLVVRALARPNDKDSAGNPILGQVLVDQKLQPGDPSYADVLNGGADMQEYPDMANLKQLATQYLEKNHPTLIANVKAAFANVVPAAELTSDSQADIFHFICQNLYDDQERMASLKGPAADAAIAAVVKMLDQLRADSAQFQAFILAQGNTLDNTPAPKSTAP